MPAVNQDVTHYAGNSARIMIPVLDGDGNAVDLAGATARWWMAKSNISTGADIYIKKSSGSGLTIDHDTAGLYTITVTIDPSDTEGNAGGTFYHECQVVDASANVSTVAIGKFILKPTLIPDA